MRTKDLQTLRMRLFLDGLRKSRGADALHRFIDEGLAGVRKSRRRGARRKRSA